MKTRKKKLFSIGLILVIILCILSPITKLIGKAASCTFSFSGANVNVGDSFTLTLTWSTSDSDLGSFTGSVVYDSSMLELVSGDRNLAEWLTDKDITSASYNFTFKALKAGTTNVSFEAGNTYSYTSMEKMDTNCVSGTVSIVEPTTAAPTTAAPTTEALSSNAYLEALSIYPGTLSPAFDSKKYIYEVTVKNDVTKLSVSVTKADVDATYIITDTNLEVGRNVIDIKVTAADGTVLWYAIRVTRQSAETTTADTTERETSTERTTEETTTAAEESSSEANPLEVVVGSTTAYVQETLGNVDVPEGFEELNYQFRGVKVEALKGLGNSLLLLPVADETGTKLYI